MSDPNHVPTDHPDYLEGIDNVGPAFRRAPGVDYGDRAPADKAPPQSREAAREPLPSWSDDEPAQGLSRLEEKGIEARLSADPEYGVLPRVDNFQAGDLDHAVMSSVGQKAAELGIPADKFQALAKAFIEEHLAHQVDDLEGLHDDAPMLDPGEQEMQREWGKNFDEHLRFAHKVIESFADRELRSAFGKVVPGTRFQLGSWPPLVRLLARIGKQMPSDSLPGEWGGGRSDPLRSGSPQSRKAIQARINAIYAEHPAGSPGYRSSAVQRELQQLFAQLD